MAVKGQSQPSVAVILHGCGARDGSEIHETVLTLLALDQEGFVSQCFAPALMQPRCINHLSNETMVEKRSMLVEAARLARGKIRPLQDLVLADYAAVVFPGGSGTTRNLCDFADKGAEMTVIPPVAALIRDAHAGQIVLGAACIAPILIARTLSTATPRVTFGYDTDVSAIATSWGAVVESCASSSCVTDTVNRIVTTPAYMNETSLSEMYLGIRNLVCAVKDLIPVRFH